MMRGGDDVGLGGALGDSDIGSGDTDSDADLETLVLMAVAGGACNLCICVSVCARARACVCVCVCVCFSNNSLKFYGPFFPLTSLSLQCREPRGVAMYGDMRGGRGSDDGVSRHTIVWGCEGMGGWVGGGGKRLCALLRAGCPL